MFAAFCTVALWLYYRLIYPLLCDRTSSVLTIPGYRTYPQDRILSELGLGYVGIFSFFFLRVLEHGSHPVFDVLFLPAGLELDLEITNKSAVLRRQIV